MTRVGAVINAMVRRKSASRTAANAPARPCLSVAISPARNASMTGPPACSRRAGNQLPRNMAAVSVMSGASSVAAMRASHCGAGPR
ncbi:hypothetical protein G6F68_021032 [Rhizopus microsporus]|nr:hypothetical protein G6F68_021032 [Rhizopus microsporus]